MNLNLHPNVWVLALAMLFAGTSAFANRTRTAAKDSLVTAAKDSTEAKKKEQKKLTPYERLFDGKTVVSAKGKFANLYLIDKKVYLEYPVAELGKELMLSTTIAATSEPTILTVGKTNTEPLHFRFAMEDSAIVMKSVNAVLVNPYNQAYEQSVSALHYAGASMAKFNIEAFNKDSSAVVINLSPFVTASNSMIPIVPKIVDPYVVTPQPKNELNYVKQLKAFDTNCTVRTEMNYLLNATLAGVVTVASNLPVSAEVNFTLSRLPESRMLPRIADSRLGIAYNRKLKLPNYAEGIQAQYWTQRWNLVPADKAAYLAGKKSRPVRPITLYFDRDFPADWKQAVREGILEWNKAFEAAGFLGAIEVKDYPTTRKDFDIDNYTVSSIRYSPSIGQTVQGSFGANPSTGEITHATLIVSNNIGQLIAQQKFVLTAAADESARHAEPTPENIHAALRYLVMRETGRILDFLDNYAASSAYDVESLRSAKFTREHGLASSVMDETEFNYVAQPGDKGVLFTPATLGEYDYFLVKWNYTYFGDDRAAAENAMGPSWVDYRTGEIINASVMVYANVASLITSWRFVQTAQVDERVRSGKLPQDMFNHILEYVIGHEVGHTLGFMHNMAASSSFAVDSLRDAAFTRQYGTTPSIMDYARFNYIAQPGDEGVALEPPVTGAYDDYMLEWTYRYWPGNDYRKDAERLNQLVESHADDPHYRYVMQQMGDKRIDPSALEEDLGDDPVKAATYGMRNLAYIVSHLDEWVSGEDNSKRKAKLYEEIAYQGFNYISHVMMNVGGMYLYATSESSGKPRFRVVPKEKQRESVQWLLHQARTFSDLEQPELEQKLYLTGRIYRLVQQQVAHQTMRRINQVALTYYADSTSYHPAEYLEDLYQDVFGPTLRGDTLSETDKDLQLLFADMLLSTVRSIRTSPGALSLHDDEPAFEAFLQRHSDHLCSLTPERESAHQSLIHRNFGNGYGELRDIWPQSIDLSSRYRFQYTQKVRTLVDNALKQGPAQDRAYYTYLSRLIERAMEGKK